MITKRPRSLSTRTQNYYSVLIDKFFTLARVDEVSYRVTLNFSKEQISMRTNNLSIGFILPTYDGLCDSSIGSRFLLMQLSNDLSLKTNLKRKRTVT